MNNNASFYGGLCFYDFHSSDKLDYIICLHGFGYNSNQFFTTLLPLLSKHYNVIMLDLPCHGLSSKESVNNSNFFSEFVNHICLTKRISILNLMGYCLGARVLISSILKISKNISINKIYLLAPGGITNDWKEKILQSNTTRLFFKIFFIKTKTYLLFLYILKLFNQNRYNFFNRLFLCKTKRFRFYNSLLMIQSISGLYNFPKEKIKNFEFIIFVGKNDNYCPLKKIKNAFNGFNNDLIITNHNHYIVDIKLQAYLLPYLPS